MIGQEQSEDKNFLEEPWNVSVHPQPNDAIRVTQVTSLATFSRFTNNTNWLLSHIDACDLSFFKASIAPTVHHAANRRGGKFILTVNGSTMKEHWQKLCRGVAGNTFPFCEVICGLILNKRTTIELWISTPNTGVRHTIKQHLSTLLGIEQIDFRFHDALTTNDDSKFQSNHKPTVVYNDHAFLNHEFALLHTLPDSYSEVNWAHIQDLSKMHASRVHSNVAPWGGISGGGSTSSNASQVWNMSLPMQPANPSPRLSFDGATAPQVVDNNSWRVRNNTGGLDHSGSNTPKKSPAQVLQDSPLSDGQRQHDGGLSTSFQPLSYQSNGKEYQLSINPRPSQAGNVNSDDSTNQGSNQQAWPSSLLFSNFNGGTSKSNAYDGFESTGTPDFSPAFTPLSTPSNAQPSPRHFANNEMNAFSPLKSFTPSKGLPQNQPNQVSLSGPNASIGTSTGPTSREHKTGAASSIHSAHARRSSADIDWKSFLANPVIPSFEELKDILSPYLQYYVIQIVDISETTPYVRRIMTEEGCAKCLRPCFHSNFCRADAEQKVSDTSCPNELELMNEKDGMFPSKVPMTVSHYVILCCKTLGCIHVTHLPCLLEGFATRVNGLTPSLQTFHSSSFFRVAHMPPSLSLNFKGGQKTARLWSIELSFTHLISNAEVLHLSFPFPVASVVNEHSLQEFIFLKLSDPPQHDGITQLTLDKEKPLGIDPNESDPQSKRTGSTTASTPLFNNNETSFHVSRGQVIFSCTDLNKGGLDVYKHTCNYDLSSIRHDAHGAKLILIDFQTRNILTLGLYRQSVTSSPSATPKSTGTVGSNHHSDIATTASSTPAQSPTATNDDGRSDRSDVDKPDLDSLDGWVDPSILPEPVCRWKVGFIKYQLGANISTQTSKPVSVLPNKAGVARLVNAPGGSGESSRRNSVPVVFPSGAGAYVHPSGVATASPHHATVPAQVTNPQGNWRQPSPHNGPKRSNNNNTHAKNTYPASSWNNRQSSSSSSTGGSSGYSNRNSQQPAWEMDQSSSGRGNRSQGNRNDRMNEMRLDEDHRNPLLSESKDSTMEFPSDLTPAQVAGRVVSMAKSHNGSRFVQLKLESGSVEFFELFFNEMKDHVTALMVDNFGHFAIEKLLTLCDSDQLLTLLNGLAPSIVAVACQKHGSFAVQALIDALSTPTQMHTLTEALKPGVGRVITHASGHFAILRMLHRFPYQYTSFVDEAIANNLLMVGTDHHGLRIVKAIVSLRRPAELTRIFKQIIRATMKLVENQYGNYVIQAVLDVAQPAFCSNIKVKMEGKYMRLSKQKFSSNVVEKCLKQPSNHWRSVIIKEITQQPAVADLLRDRYGNYVLQTALSVASPAQATHILQSITPHLSSLRDNVRAKWTKMLRKTMNQMPHGGGIDPGMTETLLNQAAQGPSSSYRMHGHGGYQSHTSHQNYSPHHGPSQSHHGHNQSQSHMNQGHSPHSQHGMGAHHPYSHQSHHNQGGMGHHSGGHSQSRGQNRHHSQATHHGHSQGHHGQSHVPSHPNHSHAGSQGHHPMSHAGAPPFYPNGGSDDGYNSRHPLY